MKFLIAHISKPSSTNNNSYTNYYYETTKINKDDNMQWDDNEKNTLTIGDFVIFYCWGERVEIHKVVNFTTNLTKRRPHWKPKSCNVLYLSPCLNTYSFKNFGTYDPPYSVYKQGFRKKNAYDLHNYPKLQYELNKNKEKNHSDTTIKNYYNAHVAVETEEETEEQREEREEAEAKATLERLARAKAVKKAKAEIIPLREAKAEIFKTEAQRKRAEAERHLKEAENAEAEAEAILRGERDETISSKETRNSFSRKS